MYKIPSRRKKTKDKNQTKLNLIPVLDSVFIFLFFLLISASFVKLYEINSDVPIVSENDPPPDKKPLALSLEISSKAIRVFKGVPSRLIQTFKNFEDGSFDLLSLHDYLIEIKKNNLNENMIIFNMQHDISYENLVQIMDAVRLLKNTDPSLFKKDPKNKDLDIIIKNLFDNIIIGNIME